MKPMFDLWKQNVRNVTTVTISSWLQQKPCGKYSSKKHTENDRNTVTMAMEVG